MIFTHLFTVAHLIRRYQKPKLQLYRVFAISPCTMAASVS